MASWQAHCANAVVRMLMRHETNASERTLALMARFATATPLAFQWLRTFGVKIDRVRTERFRGEWQVPRHAERGTILYFHGGGYIAGSAAGYRPLTVGLARLARRRVFSLDYRRAPEHRFPAALDDAVLAYRWLLDDQGVSPRALALAGDSAGGGLVIATLLRLRDLGVPLPAAGVCFCPWTDLAATGESLRTNNGRCPSFHPATIPKYARIYLGGASDRDPYASPVFGNLAGLPPLLLQAASNELLVDDARRIHDSVQKAGGVSRLEIFDDLFHDWPILDGFLPEARQALRQAAAFLDEHAC
jgi:epsilon-lactone hydrolase